MNIMNSMFLFVCFIFLVFSYHRLQPKKTPPVSVRVPPKTTYPERRLSANDKGDNKVILGTVHRSPGICLAAEETPGKPQLGDRR